MIRFVSFLVKNLLSYAKKRYSLELRKAILSRFKAVGANFTFDPLTSTFINPGTICIGSNVFFNQKVYLSGNITIGNNVMLGPSAAVLSGNHMFALKGKSIRWLALTQENVEDVKTVVVEDEVWIGAGVTILGNTTIGIGAVIGAASVVVGDVVPFTVSVGNPCKPVRLIFDNENLKEHLRLLGYSAHFANGVIARRSACVKDPHLQVIDKSNSYTKYYYQGELVDNSFDKSANDMKLVA
jgi:acetyltransferase-like isoleucine patch superfamily enzyme